MAVEIVLLDDAGQLTFDEADAADITPTGGVRIYRRGVQTADIQLGAVAPGLWQSYRVTGVELEEKYPYQNGDVTVLGPDVFVDAEETIINYKGENFYASPEVLEEETPETLPPEQAPGGSAEVEPVVEEEAEETSEQQ